MIELLLFHIYDCIFSIDAVSSGAVQFNESFGPLMTCNVPFMRFVLLLLVFPSATEIQYYIIASTDS